MFSLILLWIGVLIRLFRSRGNLVLENLVLRQQLAVLKRRHPRPSLGLFDKLFWVIARRVWSAWKESLLIVTPETVVRWHRTSFRIYWRLISRVRAQAGRRPTPKEVRELIFRMVADNPTWGAPRIHGELRMLGFELCERTISRWMKRAPRDPDWAKRWLVFLETIGKRLRPWISLLCQPSPSACSTASSSSIMTGGTSCTLTSRSIRRALGSSSSCARRFPLKPLTNT